MLQSYGLAKAEKINESYLCRVLRLTLLSPAITEAILNGLQPGGLELAQLLKSIAAEWDEQQVLISSTAQKAGSRQPFPKLEIAGALIRTSKVMEFSNIHQGFTHPMLWRFCQVDDLKVMSASF